MSGTNIKRDNLRQRLLSKKQANDAELKKKEGKVVQDKEQKGALKRKREKSHVTSTGVFDKEVINQPLMITQGGDLNLPDGFVRDAELSTKIVKAGDSSFSIELPDAVLEKASSSSISFQKKTKCVLSLPGDLEIAKKYSRGEGFEHMLGHLSQAYSWSIQLSEQDRAADEVEAQLKKSYESEARKFKAASTKIEKLEKEMGLLRSKVEDLEGQLVDSQSREDKLKLIIAAKTKEVEDAEEHWYQDAVNCKLLKAKELFGDAYVGLVDPWDEDPNVEETDTLIATPPSAESQSPEKLMIDEDGKEKTTLENDPQDRQKEKA